jgi:hypothetical protein
MPPALLLILLAAAAQRILIVIPPDIDWDESWVGTAAINVLKGVFPTFFYGQPYMAGLESYLHAVVFASLGASRWTLKLLPVVFAVVFVYLAFRLAVRLLYRPAAYAVALVAALPGPAIAGWSVNARLHYSLTPLLGLLLLLLALRVMVAPAARAPALWFVLGLLAGLVWWNNYIGVIYLGAVGCVLLALRTRGTLRQGVRCGLPGFVLGSLPMWLYNAHAGVLFLSPRGTWGAWQGIPSRIYGFLVVTLPGLLGVEPPPSPTVGWVGQALLVGGLVVLGLVATVHGSARRDARLALIPLVFLNMVLLAGVSVYGDELPVRYVFPLAAVIPLIFGAAFQALAGWSRPVAWALVGLSAVLSGWSAVDAASGLSGHRERIRQLHAEEADEARLFAALRRLGAPRVYSTDNELNFFSGGALVLSNPFDDPHPPFAEAVDGQATAAVVNRGPLDELEAGLRALGVEYRLERVPPWVVYHGFNLRQVRYEEIPPDSWTATADEMPRRASHAFDREIGTAWTSEPGQRPGVRYVLDLERLHEVGMVAWTPEDFGEVPRGIEVAVSSDGWRWETVASVPRYGVPVYWSGAHPFLRLRRARVEVRFPASPARFVRLTQTGSERDHPWSIRELFVYRPVAAATDPDLLGLDTIARLLGDRGVKRIYGDHWVLARLKLASQGAKGPAPTKVPNSQLLLAWLRSIHCVPML